MKISVNWIKQLVDFELPAVDELVAKIGAQLGEIESVENLGEKYRGIIVAKVVECEKHPNADKLSLCKIDDGGKANQVLRASAVSSSERAAEGDVQNGTSTEQRSSEGGNAQQSGRVGGSAGEQDGRSHGLGNVERDENGLVQVVCGAPNVRKDLLVAWLPPGSTVPSSVGSDPFVLEVRELRGKVSNGMLASPKELAISDNHEGILEIDKDAKPGDDFAKLYKLNDYVIDIENKMFTHRPDCFGALGVAREIAGILGHQFKSPDWYLLDSVDIPLTAEQALELEVNNEAEKLVPRFMVTPMSGVEVKPSPVWLQVALSKIGQKPINNVVDLTNFYMQLTGQPLHAYDYDKLRGFRIGARLAKRGEKAELLNGKTYQLDESDIVIVDGEGIIGLGGVMGGLDSEVTNETKNIVVECANFDMYSVRRTSMRHGLFTDAVTRFTKGQSPLQNRVVLAKIVEDLGKLADAKVAGNVIDKLNPTIPTYTKSVHLGARFVWDRLGIGLEAGKEIKELLENVEFVVEQGGELVQKTSVSYNGGSDFGGDQQVADQDMKISIPFWRTDIELPEDIVEEVGRLHGYDKLPLELPKRSIKPAPKNDLLELKSKIRENLSKAGANEVLTYSFVHGNLLEKVGQNKDDAFQLSNALSPDLQYYRLSLMPSLLDKVHQNIKAGYDKFALFELGKTHFVGEMDENDPGVPNEDNHLALVIACNDKQKPSGAPYYAARRYLEQLVDLEKLKLVPLAQFDLTTDEWGKQLASAYEPGRSAVIIRDNQIWGVVGEFKAGVARALKLPAFTAGFEIHLDVIAANTNQLKYAEQPKYPKVEQDISLKVPADVKYQDLYDCIWSALREVQPEHTLPKLNPLDIFQREDDKAHKQIAFRFTVASYDKTMTTEEVSKMLDQAAKAAKEKFTAERL